jgi:hypothetical protein
MDCLQVSGKVCPPCSFFVSSHLHACVPFGMVYLLVHPIPDLGHDVGRAVFLGSLRILA